MYVKQNHDQIPLFNSFLLYGSMTLNIVILSHSAVRTGGYYRPGVRVKRAEEVQIILQLCH